MIWSMYASVPQLDRPLFERQAPHRKQAPFLFHPPFLQGNARRILGTQPTLIIWLVD